MTEQEQIEQLKAQVNCLRDALNKAKDKLSNENIYDNNIRFALQANPEQCLAKVKAKEIEEYKQEQAEMKQMELATKLMVSSIYGESEMITDEQICIACAAYDSSDVAHSQIVAMRKALEAYEASKWVKFDVDDVSTWPPITKQPYASIPVMVYCTDNKETFYSSKFVTNLHRLLPTNKGYAYWIHPFDRDKHLNVTHWQPLPTFKE